MTGRQANMLALANYFPDCWMLQQLLAVTGHCVWHSQAEPTGRVAARDGSSRSAVRL